MKKLILALTIVLSGSLCEASVLSFKAWKARRVNEARSAVRQFKGDLQTAKKSGHEDSIKTQEIRLEQAEINVEITQELGPTDYFVLYLAKNFPKDSSAVRQAVTKMSQSEVAEILMSYQKKLEEEHQYMDTGSTPTSLLVPLFRINQRAQADSHSSVE